MASIKQFMKLNNTELFSMNGSSSDFFFFFLITYFLHISDIL